MTDARPYKGPRPFEPEDAGLFFGREDEARLLLSQILSSRVTLLYAPSGAGKTSLLNTCVMPDLEREGWIPVRVRLGYQPVRAVREATLRALLLDPGLEARALERAAEALACLDSPQHTIADILEKYDALHASDTRRRELLAPMVSPAVRVGTFDVISKAEVTPRFASLLRGSLGLSRFAEGVEMLAGARTGVPSPSMPLSEATRVVDALAIFRDKNVVANYETLLKELSVPAPGLVVFLRQVCEVGAASNRRFGLVIILDQFEEIFTHFYDPTPAPVQADTAPQGDWRLRWHFFSELEGVYSARHRIDDNLDLLPVRFLISMREEYLGRLGPLREFIPDLDQHSFRLGLLSVEQAQVAVREPANAYNYGYSEECFDRIIRGLTKEERYVEPAHLQIICDRLWENFGKHLVAPGHASSASDLPRINADALVQEAGVQGILRSFLRGVLGDLDRERCMAALEILDMLITEGRTRNIVEVRSLVDAPYRDVELRWKAIDILVNKTIIRTEPRFGSEFVEVTHEFLIEPILEEVRTNLTADPEYQAFLHAVSGLEHWVAMDFRSTHERLPAAEEVSRIHAVRHRIQWDRDATELMLRAAVVNGSSAEIVRVWSERFGDKVSGVDRLDEASRRLVGKGRLRRADWQVLDSLRAAVPRTRVAVVAMLRSALRFASERETDSVRYWTSELLVLGGDVDA